MRRGAARYDRENQASGRPRLFSVGGREGDYEPLPRPSSDSTIAAACSSTYLVTRVSPRPVPLYSASTTIHLENG